MARQPTNGSRAAEISGWVRTALALGAVILAWASIQGKVQGDIRVIQADVANIRERHKDMTDRIDKRLETIERVLGELRDRFPKP